MRTLFRHSVATFILLALCLSCCTRLAAAEGTPSPATKGAIETLKSKAVALGAPKLDGGNLYFGSTKINEDYTIVDEVKAEKDCNATLFVKSGDQFIRVSTNVITSGKRAVGTPLDPKGKAIQSLVKGEPFYGMVDVMSTKMDTAYEPIKSSDGTVIGAYFVGFPE